MSAQVTVYELGGKGTYCRRFFVHLGCLPDTYKNSWGEVVAMEARRRMLPVRDAAVQTCPVCGNRLVGE